MYKENHTVFGIILLLICLCISLIPLMQLPEEHNDVKRSGDRLIWKLTDISPAGKGTIRINSSGADDLTALPGIGDTYAKLIVDEREKNGPYFYAEDLEAVKGIGPYTLSKFRDMIDLTEYKGE